MTIGLTHKAVGHLKEAILLTATEITLILNEYEQVLAAPDDVYLMLRGPVYRELVKVDLSASVWGQYLTIARGQGVTSARAWPVGTLLFATTHEDHYNSIIQAAGNRTIDYNPNEILTPLYGGEKVYQTDPAGCERWWKSFNGVDPYWDIITGAACGEENYRDIGWTYDLLLPALPWQMEFDLYAQPSNPKRVYSAGYDPTHHDLYVGTQPAQIWKSSDGGDTWAMIKEISPFNDYGLSYVYCLAYNETDDTLFAGTSDAEEQNKCGIWRSSNQGATWTQVFDIYAGTPSEGAVRTIIHDPYHDTMVAGSGSNDALIYYSDDGGDNWTLKEDLSNKFPSQDIIASIAYEPTTHNIVVGTMPSSQIWLSEDGGDTWAKVLQLDYQYVNSIVYSADEDALFLTHTGGTYAEIWKSTDGGDNWALQQTLNQPPDDRKSAHHLAYNSDNNWIHFATQQQSPWTDPYGSQIWISTDGGENFVVDQLFYNQYIYSLTYDSYHNVTIAGFWKDPNLCQIWKRRNTL
jgi:photosystem II stability/assembly factor-like uncharacterized protein